MNHPRKKQKEPTAEELNRAIIPYRTVVPNLPNSIKRQIYRQAFQEHVVDGSFYSGLRNACKISQQVVTEEELLVLNEKFEKNITFDSKFTPQAYFTSEKYDLKFTLEKVPFQGAFYNIVSKHSIYLKGQLNPLTTIQVYLHRPTDTLLKFMFSCFYDRQLDEGRYDDQLGRFSSSMDIHCLSFDHVKNGIVFCMDFRSVLIKFLHCNFIKEKMEHTLMPKLKNRTSDEIQQIKNNIPFVFTEHFKNMTINTSYKVKCMMI